MKKIFVTLVIAAIAVIGTGVFSGCKKEDVIQNEQTIDRNAMKSADDYQLHGINIDELASKTYSISFKNDVLLHTETIQSQASNITQEEANAQFLYWENLCDRINSNADNMDSLYTYYQIFSTQTYRANLLDVVTYNNNTYSCANSMLASLQNSYNTVYNAISQDYPAFKNLTFEKQMEVIEEVLCYGPCEDELIRARNRASAKYILASLACLGTGPTFVGLCFAGARAQFWKDINEAIDIYHGCVDC